MRRTFRYLIIAVVSLCLEINSYSQTPPPVTSVGTAVFADGTWSVPVQVTGFVNVGNISMKLNYDATKLTYTGATVNTGLDPGNTLISSISDQSGIFRLSYSSSIAIIMGAPTNTLLTITFTQKPDAGGVQTFLTWSTKQGDCEIAPPVPATYVPVMTAANMSDYFVNGSLEIPRTLNLNLHLEGLYAGAGVMRQAQGASGNQFPGTVADLINVELHDASTYSNILYTEANVNLDKSGLAMVTVPSANSGSYYITVRHRNSIATVSSAPVSFASGTINYDFTNNGSKAFGSNMKNLGIGVFGIYTGDINSDGIVDGFDLINVENNVALFPRGYLLTDLNGDGIVDGFDLILSENNSLSFVRYLHP